LANRQNDRKPAAASVDRVVTLAYGEAFHVIRLYTEQVCVC